MVAHVAWWLLDELQGRGCKEHVSENRIGIIRGAVFVELFLCGRKNCWRARV